MGKQVRKADRVKAPPMLMFAVSGTERSNLVQSGLQLVWHLGQPLHISEQQ